jgi:hypothetical protein
MYTHLAQKVALFRAARRAPHLGPGTQSQLHGSLAHATGSGVNQHAFTRLEPGAAVQGVVGGDEGDGQRGGIGKAKLGRFLRQVIGASDGGGAVAVGGGAKNSVAGLEAGDVRTNGRYHPGALITKNDIRLGIHVQRLQHVAEVHAGGPDANFDLTWTGGTADGGLQHQVVQLPRWRMVRWTDSAVGDAAG